MATNGKGDKAQGAQQGAQAQAQPQDSDDLKVKAGAVVLPEYEQRLAQAHASADVDGITEVTGEYHKAREKRARAAQKREQEATR